MNDAISDIVSQKISRLLATHILATPINAGEKFSEQGWDYVFLCYVTAWGGQLPFLPPARYGPGHMEAVMATVQRYI